MKNGSIINILKILFPEWQIFRIFKEYGFWVNDIKNPERKDGTKSSSHSMAGSQTNNRQTQNQPTSSSTSSCSSSSCSSSSCSTPSKQRNNRSKKSKKTRMIPL